MGEESWLACVWFPPVYAHSNTSVYAHDNVPVHTHDNYPKYAPNNATCAIFDEIQRCPKEKFYILLTL